MSKSENKKEGGSILNKKEIRNEKAIKRKNKENKVYSFFKKLGRMDDRTESSFFLGLIRKISLKKRFIKPLKYNIARAKDESMVFYALSQFGKMLLSLDLLNYGTFLLIFSITSLLTEGARALITTSSIYSIDLAQIILSLVVFISSMALVFSGKGRSLAEGIHGSVILSFFVFNLFGVRRESLKAFEKTKSELFLMILLGVALGVSVIWVSPGAILLTIAIAVVSIIIFNVPESGIIMTLLFAPFLSDGFLFVLTAYVWLCFVMKLVVGKRSFKLTFTDFVVICFGIMVFVAGATSIGGVDYEKGFMGLWVVLCFILVSVFIKNRAWIARCRMVITISGVIYGIFIIVSVLLNNVINASSIKMGAYLSSYIPNNVEENGIILLLSIFFVFSYVTTNVKTKSRFYMLLLSGIMILAMFLTYSWQLWLAFIIGFGIYKSYTSPKTVSVFAFIIAVVIVLLIVVPNTALENILDFAGFSATEISEAMESNKALLKIAGKNILGGIGLCESTLQSNLAVYSISFEDLKVNTVLLMLSQVGIFGVALLGFAFLLIAGSYFVWNKGKGKEKNLRSVGVAIMSMFVSVMVLSNLKYTFADLTASLTFWMMIGLVYSTCKVIKDELSDLESADERVFYVDAGKMEVKNSGEQREAEG